MPSVATKPVPVQPSGAGTTLTNIRGTFSNQPVGSGTGTLSNVSDSATSVTVLAANSGRLGAVIYNDSGSTLYLKFGATASVTSFSVKLLPESCYEMEGPHIYTGILDGIWDTAPGGAARVTELT